MKGSYPPGRRFLLVAWILSAVLAVGASVGARQLLRARGLSESDAIAVAVGLGGAILALFGGPLFIRWLDEVRDACRTDLDEWRSQLRIEIRNHRVRERSQLAEMIRQGTVLDLQAADDLDLLATDAGQPRIRAQGRLVPMSNIAQQWDRSSPRMVILGEPGYGKTVAALILLSHVNGSPDSPGEPVAELFPLADWYRWRKRHRPDETLSLSAWLVDQLHHTYPNVPTSVAERLVDEGLVVPFLDGLDEVPELNRVNCKEAIDAYAGRAEPFRPFVLTCRSREYAELAPEWVTADNQLELVGLQPDQVIAVIGARTLATGGWGEIRDRLVGGDGRLGALFRSPLRLAVALEAYRTRDPLELVHLDEQAARNHLWKLLLSLNDPEFDGAAPERVRSWLVSMATVMQAGDIQRFHPLLDLFRLTILDPVTLTRFGRVAGLVVGLFCGSISGITFGLVFGSIVGWSSGLIVGTLFGVSFMRFWETCGSSLERGRLTAEPARWFRNNAVGLYFTMTIVSSTAAAVLVGLFAEIVIGLLVGAITEFLASLIVGAPFGTIVGASAGIVLGMAVGAYVTLLFTASFPLGAITGILGSLAEVTLRVYSRWLRFDLARKGLLPRRLPEFLVWCAAPERGWLRELDGYEFRHRDLLDYLAGPELQPRP